MTTEARATTERFDPLAAMLRGWWIMLLGALVGAAALAAVYATAEPEWTSEAVLTYDPRERTLAIAGGTGLGATDVGRALATESRAVLGDAVVSVVSLSAGVTPQDLREMTTVETSVEDNAITISVTDESPGDAAEIAQAFADAAVEDNRARGAQLLLNQGEALTPAIEGVRAQVAALPIDSATRGALSSELAALVAQQERLRVASAVYPGQLTQLRAAALPVEPSSPGPVTGAAVGGALGLGAGALLALALGSADHRRGARPVRARQHSRPPRTRR